MSMRTFSRHLGVAAALAAIAFAIVVPTMVVPLSEHRAGAVAEEAAMRAARHADGALERGERADVLTDRIGAITGHRIRVISRDGSVLGDTGRDGPDIDVPLPDDVRHLVDEVRTRGAMTKKVRLGGQTVAAAGLERGTGTVVLAYRPLEGIAPGFGPIRAAVVSGAFAFAFVTLGFILVLGIWLRPARELGDVARALAKGNFAVRARSERDDELGELGRAIDGMADQLRARVDRLTTEEARLSTVLDAMSEAVFVTDASSRIVLTNAAMNRLVTGTASGRTPIEAIRSPELHAAVRDAQDGGASTVELEIRVGDELRNFVATVARMPGDAGVVVVMHDVTKLKEVDRIRRDFVANASHELRTPLTAIRGYAETLRDGAYMQKDSAERFLDVILRHTIRLQRLVDDLIALSRAESPDSTMELAEVDAAAVVIEVVRGLETNASAKSLTLTLELPADLPLVVSNEPALDQIVVNLVDNAIKYSPTSGTVRIRGSVRDSRVVLEVWNSGPPIAAHHLDRLFERFYRVDPGRSREVGGTGLGLSIVRHLAQRIGADVSVESRRDAGTAFRVALPVTTAPAIES